MTHELRVNGNLELIVRPADDIQLSILKAMAELAGKGKTVTLQWQNGENPGLSVSVEKKPL